MQRGGDNGGQEIPSFSSSGNLPDHSSLESHEIVDSRGIVGYRVVAKIIDLIMIGIIQMVVIVPLYFIGIFTILAAAIPEDSSETNEVGSGFFIALGGLWLAMIAVSLGVTAAYYFLMENRSQQTFGKRAFELKVVDEDGSKASSGKILARAALSTLMMWFPLWLAELLVMSLREDGRRLTDMITGTRVVKVMKVYHLPMERGI